MVDKKPKRSPANKAQNLLLRFPVTDLACAVALTGQRRLAYLKRFIGGGTVLSYVPTREAAIMIYGVQKPLFESPIEPWEKIERHLRDNTDPTILDMNLNTSKLLFKLVRTKKYAATEHPEQVLRVGPKQIVPIGLSFYITEGDRLIFQFAHPRIDCLSDMRMRAVTTDPRMWRLQI
jgi:hypothetical protein